AAGGVSVTIADAAGRVNTRTVSDVEVAAWLIESAARDDLEDALLAPRKAEIAERRAEHRVPIRPSDQLTQEAVALPATQARSLEVRIGFESAVADNRSVWIGASASTCARFGDFCIGLLARAATETSNGDAFFFQSHAVTAGLLLGADLELEV